jgi:hypothetical protein
VLLSCLFMLYCPPSFLCCITFFTLCIMLPFALSLLCCTHFLCALCCSSLWLYGLHTLTYCVVLGKLQPILPFGAVLFTSLSALYCTNFFSMLCCTHFLCVLFYSPLFCSAHLCVVLLTFMLCCKHLLSELHCTPLFLCFIACTSFLSCTAHTSFLFGDVHLSFNAALYALFSVPHTLPWWSQCKSCSAHLLAVLLPFCCAARFLSMLCCTLLFYAVLCLDTSCLPPTRNIWFFLLSSILCSELISFQFQYIWRNFAEFRDFDVKFSHTVKGTQINSFFIK